VPTCLSLGNRAWALPYRVNKHTANVLLGSAWQPYRALLIDVTYILSTRDSPRSLSRKDQSGFLPNLEFVYQYPTTQYEHRRRNYTPPSLRLNHPTMAAGASFSSSAAPRTGDLEANLPEIQRDSAHQVNREGCFYSTWFDVKHEWKTGAKQMRHWIAITLIMVLSLGLAVYYTVGNHD